MRYYYLDIQKDGAPIKSADGEDIGPFDTAKTPTYGLDLQFDLSVVDYDIMQTGTEIKLFGIPVSFLTQAVNFIDAKITITAGFDTGLPLSNAQQKGIIFAGNIFDAYGNWQSTVQSLNFIVQALPFKSRDPFYSSYLPESPSSISFSVAKNDPLAPQIKRTLEEAFPGFAVDLRLTEDRLIATENINFTARSMQEYAAMLRGISKQIIRDKSYIGIGIAINGTAIRVYDNNVIENTRVVQINPEEIIGQPTWIKFPKISFKVPLRADIRVGDIVKLPNDLSGNNSVLAISQSNSFSRARYNLTFNNEYVITAVRHIGGYASTNANESWVTIFEGYFKSSLIKENA